VTWFEDLAWAALAVAPRLCRGERLGTLVRGYRQKMAIMDAVWPITALCWGPVAVWQYFTRARVRPEPVLARIGGMEQAAEIEGGQQPEIAGTGLVAAVESGHPLRGGLHSGRHRRRVDRLRHQVHAGRDRPARRHALDFILAWSFGVVLQYFTIEPIRGETGPKSVWPAIRPETRSVLAFQLGLFAGMATYNKVSGSGRSGVGSSPARGCTSRP
jgi:hypothetical protein